MKKYLIFVCSIICSYFFFSCTTKKEMAIECVNEFLTSIRDENISYNAYPLAKNITTFHKIDNFTIQNINKLDNKKFSIQVNCSFTNGFGKTFNHNMTFYLHPIKNSSKYQIYDSKNVCPNYKQDNSEYCFAIKTGCINKYDKTDQQISKKLEVATQILLHTSFLVSLEIHGNLKIKNWYWETSYGSAHGHGICVNNTKYYIHQPKYKIKYLDRKNGNVITEDSGYITYDILSPGESKSFNFYSGYVGNSRYAHIEVDYDFTKTIYNYVLNSNEYTGNEYNEMLEIIASRQPKE